MDCLFIHGNYPGQFKHIAPLLAGLGHRVVFLTNRPDAKDHAQPGIEIHNYNLHRNPSEQTHHYLQSSEDAVLQGQAILRKLNGLIEEGFSPRIAFTHGGMGLGLFIKDLLPHCIQIGYFEWYFQPITTQHLVAEFDFDMRLKTGLRNLPILQELERCDLAVVPTEWQKQQFPTAYHSKLNVIFDGIDREFFHPNDEKLTEKLIPLQLHNRETSETFAIPKGAKIISYATRGMETLRGFPEFMRSLPELFASNNNLYAVVAGADRRAYSYDAPSHEGSWKKLLLEEIEAKVPKKQILFTGLLNYIDYRALLWRSNLHCYFTRPYVTSWSLFEAAACGTQMAVNRSPATTGIAAETSVTWVDLDDQSTLNRQLREALAQPGKRSELMPGFDLETTLKHWEQLLNHALQSN